MKKIAYLDCPSGISGDMTLAAMVDAGVPLDLLQAGIDSLELPSCKLVASEVSRRGFRALHINVEHEPEHAHRHLSDIESLIAKSSLTKAQKELAIKIFRAVAVAEAKVHGTTIERVHFHEVGAVDSIADIVGAAIGWNLLGVDRVVCSPVPTGTGFIEIAHGRVAVPAPATAELLRGIPIAASSVEGELTTPTGAAIVKTLADSFGPLPAMTIETIGYGAGTADFPQPNIVRLILGRAENENSENRAKQSSQGCKVQTETIGVLQTNIDDCSGEQLGYAAEKLWEAGALDVAMTALQMKKGRPGVLLTVQCRIEDIETMEAILFTQTTTLGVRRQWTERRTLPRETCSVETEWGPIAGERYRLPGGKTRFSPAYEACKELANRLGISLSVVYEAAQLSAKQEANSTSEGEVT